MKFKRLLVIVAAVIVVGIFLYLKLTGAEQQALPIKKALPAKEEPVVEHPPVQPSAEQGSDELPLHPGVNLEFHDEPHIQVGWMDRAKTVIDNNLPDFATSAEVKETFFHRGFKGWAVTCGEVQLYRDGEIVQDFQRFVFPGVQTIYYENQIKNFHIYWDKVCTQKQEG